MKKMFLSSCTTGTIRIDSKTSVVIRRNSIISASLNISEYFVDDSIFFDACERERGRSLIYANGKTGIEITAERNAVLNGQGKLCVGDKFEYKRPGLIRIVNCRDIKISNLILLDSACWAISLENCDNVVIDNVNIVSKWASNNTGIDIDCCRNVIVKNCVLDVGDDAIAVKSTEKFQSENILIENCTIASEWSAFKLGTETVGDFSNIIFKNSVVQYSNGCAIKIVPTDGGKVKDVLIENIEILDSTGPIFIANGQRNASYRGESSKEESTISGVILSDIKANVHISDGEFANGIGDCVFITGTKRRKIENVVLQNCCFEMPGGNNAERNFSVQELFDQYPEYYTLGLSPASGAYFRHINGLTIDNVNIELKEHDKRQKIIYEDVNGLKNN